LKRKLYDLLGLGGLSQDDKVKRAYKILSDSDYKQTICHEHIGLSHKDIDKLLKEIIKDKRNSFAEQLAIECDVELPVEEDSESETIERVITKLKVVYMLDMDEVNMLLLASETPLVKEPSKNATRYPTYTQADVTEIMNMESFTEKKKVVTQPTRKTKK
jgi:hypothetical protein